MKREVLEYMADDRGWSVDLNDWVYGTKVDETTMLMSDGDYEEVAEGSFARNTNFTSHFGDAIYVGDEGYIAFPTTASNPLFVGDDGCSYTYVKFVEIEGGFDAVVSRSSGDVYLDIETIRAELSDMGRKFRFALKHTEYELLNKVYTVSVSVSVEQVEELADERIVIHDPVKSEFDLRGYDWNVETVYRRVVEELVERGIPVYREDGTTLMYALNETMLSLKDSEGLRYTINLWCRRDDDHEMSEREVSGIDYWFDLDFDVYANGECEF